MVIDVICLTVSAGAVKSINRLWMRISNRSHVFVPSPQGDLRVVMRSVLVGMRTGPLCFKFFSLAPRIRSLHTAQTRIRQAHLRVVSTRLQRRSDYRRRKKDSAKTGNARCSRSNGYEQNKRQHKMRTLLQWSDGFGCESDANFGVLSLLQALFGFCLHRHLHSTHCTFQTCRITCRVLEGIVYGGLRAPSIIRAVRVLLPNSHRAFTRDHAAYAPELLRAKEIVSAF